VVLISASGVSWADAHSSVCALAGLLGVLHVWSAAAAAATPLLLRCPCETTGAAKRHFENDRHAGFYD